MLRFLIIRPGALGDTLMLLPALGALTGRVSILFVGRRPGLEFIRPHVDQVMDLEGAGWHRLFSDTPDAEGLPVSAVDSVAAFFGDEDGTICRNLERLLPDARVHVFRSFPPKGEALHVAEYLARCLASTGLPVNSAACIEAVRYRGLCDHRPPPKGEQRIVLHPGSGSREKNHPAGFWIDLIYRLGREALFQDARCQLLIGPAEEPLYDWFSKQLGPGEAEIVPSWDRDLLLETLDRAALYLGHDSGVTHLAALRSVPTIALFKNSDVAQWMPLGPWVRVIESRNSLTDLADAVLEAAVALWPGRMGIFWDR